MRHDDSRKPTRREALAAGLATAGALGLGVGLGQGPRAHALETPPRDDYGPFRMGIQSYSLRGYKALDAALARTKELGLGYWESYNAHIPPTTDADKLGEVQAKLKAAGVQVMGFGVVRFTRDADAGKKLFDFGKALGLRYFSADPDPDSFDVLDKLVEEYGIAVGIHNHGPGHRYDKIDTIQKAIQDHHKRIGVCNDTGHFLRSREDPVRAVEVFGERTYGVHLKDVKDAKTFTVLGEGDLRTADLLKALAALKYDYTLALEYEEHPEDPMAEIRTCLSAVRKAVASMKG